MGQTILVTGGLGCIGAHTAAWLLDHTDASVLLASRNASLATAQAMWPERDLSRVKMISLDIQEPDQIAELFEQFPISEVIHLAALQTPDCNAHRDLGLQINLAGTQHLIECMKRAANPVDRFAVYGPRRAYPEGIVPMLSEPQPVNVYGTWKLAGEQLSRYFWEDTGTPTVVVRPGVLYGPGRDAGLTSTPTTAMKCAALGLPYEIPFSNRQDYLYSMDVGAAMGLAATASFSDFGVFTLPSLTLETQEIVHAIRAGAELLGWQEPQISVGPDTVPFICELEFQPFLDRFPDAPHTSLDAAVRSTLEEFQRQVAAGQLTLESLPRG